MSRRRGRAHVAVLLVELHFPMAGSLKAKRKDLKSVKAQLQTRLGCAVAEVDHHDVWQRSTLSVALTSGSMHQLETHCDAVERHLWERFPEGVRVDRYVRSFDERGEVG